MCVWANMAANGYRENDRRKFVYDVLIGQDVVVTVRLCVALFSPCDVWCRGCNVFLLRGDDDRALL